MEAGGRGPAKTGKVMHKVGFYSARKLNYRLASMGNCQDTLRGTAKERYMHRGF